MADQWHYFANGRQLGPVPLKRLKELVDMGVVGPTSEVWQEGTPDWVAASSMRALFPNDRIKTTTTETHSRTTAIPEEPPPATTTSLEPPRPAQTRSAKKAMLVGVCLLVLVGGGIAFTVFGRKSPEQKKGEPTHPVAESTKPKLPETPPEEKAAMESATKSLMKLASLTRAYALQSA